MFWGLKPENVATPGHSTHTTAHHHGGVAILSQEMEGMRVWVEKRIARSWDAH